MHILIVDDHAGSASALLTVVESVLAASDTAAKLSVVNSFNEGIFLAMAGDFSQRPRTIFLDLTLPDAAETDPLRQMRVAASIDAHIFVWSGTSFDDETLRDSWKAGANGWIPKTLSLLDLQQAVRCALELGFYMPDDPGATHVSAVPKATNLSASELELARLVALDFNLQTIANALTSGSLRDASVQVAELCGKFGVLTLPEAAQRARAMGVK